MEKKIKPKLKTLNHFISDIHNILLSKNINDVSKKIIKMIIEEYEQCILVELFEKMEAKVGILGKIKVKVRQTRVGINPTTNEKVVIPGKAIPKFAFSKGIKEVVDNQLSDSLNISDQANSIKDRFVTIEEDESTERYEDEE